jgi:RNA polymerase sigma-70 factor (sigma-E family)
MVEPEGFRDFVERRSAALVRSAWLLTGSQAAAQDLVQAALLHTWQRWTKIVRRDAPEPYVRRVMMSIFLSSRRRRSAGETATGHLPDRADSRDRPSEVEVQHDVARALTQLSPGQRAALVLRYFDDLSEAETAEAMGCSVGTVKSQAARGLTRLRADAALRDLFAPKEATREH